MKTRTKDKYRVVYTDHQRLELEKEFHYSRYITIRRKAELAATLGLSERQVGTLQGPVTNWEAPVGRVRSQAPGSTQFCGQIKQENRETFPSRCFFKKASSMSTCLFKKHMYIVIFFSISGDLGGKTHTRARTHTHTHTHTQTECSLMQNPIWVNKDLFSLHPVLYWGKN